MWMQKRKASRTAASVFHLPHDRQFPCKFTSVYPQCRPSKSMLTFAIKRGTITVEVNLMSTQSHANNSSKSRNCLELI